MLRAIRRAIIKIFNLGHTVHFYMRGGQVITVNYVKNVKTATSSETGAFTRYSIEWVHPCVGPRLFDLALSDLQAVVAE
jgi:hypothetical protein